MSDGDTFPRGPSYDRVLPTPRNQGEQTPLRTDRYGAQYTRPYGHWREQATLDGTYFVAHNATNDAATTLAGHAAPVLADADATMTKPLIFLRMADASTKYAVLDFIEIEVITAGASGTAANWAAQIDSGTTRVTTPGTAFTRVSPNARSSNVPDLAVQGGAVVVGAETSASRDLGFGQIRPSIEIAGDIKMFVFGGDPAVCGSQSGQAAAAIRTSIICLPTVVLGATDSFLLALYAPSQASAGIYKVRMGWREE